MLKSIDIPLPSEIDTTSQGKIIGSFSLSSKEEKTDISSTRLLDPDKAEYPQIIKKSLPDDVCRRGVSGAESMGDKVVTLTNGSYDVGIVGPEGGNLAMLSIKPGGQDSVFANEVALEEGEQYSLVISPANLNFNLAVAGSVSRDVDGSPQIPSPAETFSMSFDEQRLFQFEDIPQITLKNIPARIKDLADVTWEPDVKHTYDLVKVEVTVSNLKDKKRNRSGATIECDLSSDTGSLQKIKNLSVIKRMAELADGLYKSFSIRITRSLPVQKAPCAYKLNDETKTGVVLLKQTSHVKYPEGSFGEEATSAIEPISPSGN